MPLFSYRSAWATALNSDVKLKLDAKISGKSVLPRRQGLLLPSRLPQGARVRRRLIRDRHDHRLARETRGCCHRRDGKRQAKSKVVETSGLLCVATASGQAKFALWLLTPDRQWERRCEFWTLGSQKTFILVSIVSSPIGPIYSVPERNSWSTTVSFVFSFPPLYALNQDMVPDGRTCTILFFDLKLANILSSETRIRQIIYEYSIIR
jgi:hypothetical protein